MTSLQSDSQKWLLFERILVIPALLAGGGGLVQSSFLGINENVFFFIFAKMRNFIFSDDISRYFVLRKSSKHFHFRKHLHHFLMFSQANFREYPKTNIFVSTLLILCFNFWQGDSKGLVFLSSWWNYIVLNMFLNHLVRLGPPKSGTLGRTMVWVRSFKPHYAKICLIYNLLEGRKKSVTVGIFLRHQNKH